MLPPPVQISVPPVSQLKQNCLRQKKQQAAHERSLRFDD